MIICPKCGEEIEDWNTQYEREQERAEAAKDLKLSAPDNRRETLIAQTEVTGVSRE